MAEAAKTTHYYVGCPDQTEEMQCIWAVNQEAAVQDFINGNNPYGYDVEDFDGYEILIVPASKVSVWRAEVKAIEVTKVK